MSKGWDERILQKTAKNPVDLWIQAASGGESLLCAMILDQLTNKISQGPNHINILLTSITKEGVDSLKKARKRFDTIDNITIHVAYFPLDTLKIMKKSFKLFSPKLIVLIETELWPHFLVEAKNNHIPLFLVNGRMSEKSHKNYRLISDFLHQYGPEKILAISKTDLNRFVSIFGPDKVSQMNNIKFDRIQPVNSKTVSFPIEKFIDATSPFVLFGSIRKEEEQVILSTIKQLLAKRPDIVIGLFPKHLERADKWLEILLDNGITCWKRSKQTSPPGKSSVIVWDVYGELAGAYSLATTTFVGGSLVNLGGQNFLEPLVFGLRPIIGPYWKNFAWVGKEIIDAKLVHEVCDEKELLTKLFETIDTKDVKEDIQTKVTDYFTPRKGGTEQVTQLILEKLKN